MGIFAKRNIMKHEELTFNYNVDRYGCATLFSFMLDSPCLKFLSLRRVVTRHNHAIAENPTVLGLLVARPKLTLLLWMIYTSMVSR